MEFRHFWHENSNILTYLFQLRFFRKGKNNLYCLYNLIHAKIMNTSAEKSTTFFHPQEKPGKNISDN